MKVWHLDQQQMVALEPWMRWCGSIRTPSWSNDRWSRFDEEFRKYQNITKEINNATSQ